MRRARIKPLTNDNHSRWKIPALATGLYFSQGLPFGIVAYTLPIYLSLSGVSATKVGLFTAIGFAWTAKVLWSPAIDIWGTYRLWIQGALIALTITIAMLGVVPAAGGAFWLVASLLAVASATQDIAIDALTIRMTPSNLLGPVNSARVTAYRIAIIAAGGGLALLADRLGWRAAFFAAAAMTAALFLFTFTLPKVEQQTAQNRENPFHALLEWVKRPGAATMLALILLYRMGDSALTPMIPKYWAIRGYSATEIGTVTTTLGMICTIAGAIAGGVFVARFGIHAGLLWLGVLQMGSNIGYALVATTDGPRAAMYAAAIVETFCNGLGTAAFLSFLMAICDRDHAATEYAMLSAVFALSRTIAGTVSGIGADSLGFAGFFWVTVALGVPGLLLLPLLRDRLRALNPARVVVEG